MSLSLKTFFTDALGKDPLSCIVEILKKDMVFAFLKHSRKVNNRLLWLIQNGDLSKGPDMDYMLEIVKEDYNLVNQTVINSIIASYRAFCYYGYGDNIERYKKWHKIFDLMEFDEEQRAICAMPWDTSSIYISDLIL